MVQMQDHFDSTIWIITLDAEVWSQKLQLLNIACYRSYRNPTIDEDMILISCEESEGEECVSTHVKKLITSESEIATFFSSRTSLRTS